MNEFAVVAIAAILTSNVAAAAGVSTASLQSEKKNFLFMLVSSMCVIVSVIISGLLVWVFNHYVFARFDAEYLRLFLSVLLAFLLAYVSRFILRLTTKEMYFLFETSYSFPIQTATCTGILLLVDYTRTILMNMFELSMFCVGYLLVQLIFFAIYERIDNNRTLKPARNVPLMLYTLAVVGMIFYAVGLFF